MANLYEKLECIGKGSFGEVYKGREISSGKIVALKLVDLEKADEEIDVIQREIKVMSQISNPHVVQYYTSLMRGSTLCIVMEFMSGGSLKDLIDSVGPLPEEAVATVMKALCKGLDYVHKGHKLHRDIKAANILLSAQGDVKLADFGVAGQMTSTVRQRNTFVGSPFWMAPEVIQESMYNEKADIWSAGITGLELANGLPPYATEHPYRALFLIPKNDPPRVDGVQFSKSFKDFIALCLRKNPSERASAEHLLQHSFLRKARSSAIKDLLKQKELSGEEMEQKIVIGGDSFNGSPNGSFRSPSGSPQVEVPNENTANPSIWEFDFGSLNESQTTCQEKDTNLVESKDGMPCTSGKDCVEKSVADVPSSASPAKSASCKATVEKKPSAEIVESTPKSLVLSEVILPVISQIRADEDTSGSQNSCLMACLGSLEVAFVDAESAKAGVSSLLLESLFKEALKSKDKKIKSLLQKALQNI